MAALGFGAEKGGGVLRRKAKNTGEAINRGGRGSLECAPRQREACGGQIRLESEPGAGGRGCLTGGPHLAVRASERGGGRRTGPEE